MSDAEVLFKEAMVDAPAWIEGLEDLPANYKLTEDGVWVIPPSEKGDPKPPRRISGPVWVFALARHPNGTGWGRLVRWLDADGKLHERAIPAGRFHEAGQQLAQDLAEEGLEIVPGQERSLTTYLGTYKPSVRLTSVERLGWADISGGELLFVLPTKTIIASNSEKSECEQVVFQPERYCPTVSTLKSQGSLLEWQEQVAARCSGHPYLIFSLCVALAGPLLKYARIDSGGFHLYGRSSHGKTTAAQVAASVWGGGADPADAPDQAFVRKWNSTANALEGMAAAHNDVVLILDELATCSAKDFGSVIYNLLGGQGKNAMDASRNLKKPRAWRILLLSTGEVSGKQKIEEAVTKRTARAGQLVRFLDVPTEPGIVQGLEDPRTFVDQMKFACGQYYGTAGPAFVESLIEEMKSPADLITVVMELIEGSARRLTQRNTAPEIARATTRFALVEAAGILAIETGILSLTEREVSAAVTAVHSAWLTEATSIPDLVRAVDAVRDFILKHREGRLRVVPLPPRLSEYEPLQQVKELAGYWHKGHKLFLLTNVGFKEACAGYDVRQVAKELERQNLLFKNEARRFHSKHQIPGDRKPMRFYAIKEEIIFEEPDIPPSQTDDQEWDGENS